MKIIPTKLPSVTFRSTERRQFFDISSLQVKLAQSVSQVILQFFSLDVIHYAIAVLPIFVLLIFCVRTLFRYPKTENFKNKGTPHNSEKSLKPQPNNLLFEKSDI